MKNETVKVWKSEFGQKWDFENVIFLDELRIFAPVCEDYLTKLQKFPHRKLDYNLEKWG